MPNDIRSDSESMFFPMSLEQLRNRAIFPSAKSATTASTMNIAAFSSCELIEKRTDTKPKKMLMNETKSAYVIFFIKQVYLPLHLKFFIAWGQRILMLGLEQLMPFVQTLGYLGLFIESFISTALVFIPSPH